MICQMNQEKAVLFIRKFGSNFHIACLDYLLSGKKPADEAVKSVIELQNVDGGFPCDGINGHPSSVNETLTALYHLDEIGELTSQPADQAFTFLLATQKPDGGWEEDPGLAQFNLPPWDTPGSLATRLFLTAYAAFWFGLTGFNPQSYQKALDFLLSQRDPAGKFSGFLHTTWIATSAFLLAGPQFHDIIQKGLQVLMTRPFSDWEDSQLAWAINNLVSAGLDKCHPFIQNGLNLLTSRQSQDGAWVSEDGESQTVDATLEVLRAFLK